MSFLSNSCCHLELLKGAQNTWGLFWFEHLRGKKKVVKDATAFNVSLVNL